jgi:hypothetical protein
LKHKALWFRNTKVASRTIDTILRSIEGDKYIYSSAVAYNPKRYRHYFKFAFVRHPETRFISAFKEKVLKQNYFHFEPNEYEEMKDPVNFIKWIVGLDIEKCDEHVRAQYALIDVEHVDFIGKLENFNDDFAKVANKMGFTYDKIEKRNVYKHDVELPLDVLRPLIRKVYKKDFQLFYPEDLLS